MLGLSDMMLQSGCAPHIDAAHSETITVLSGRDAGKPFAAVVEVDADAQLEASIGSKDRRARKQMRFTIGMKVPSLPPQTRIQTADGRKWTVVDDPQNGSLSTDFQILEIIPGKDLG